MPHFSFSDTQRDRLDAFERFDATGVPPEFADRARQAALFIIPFIEGLGRNTRNMRCLEVGCGIGSKAAILSPLFKEYVAIDLNEHYLAIARRIGAGMGSAAQFLNVPANELQSVLHGEPFDFVILYAVVEHLTIDERLALLRLLWNNLREHGLIYVGEAPNRLAPIDYHSSRLPFFSVLPVELASEIYEESKNANWKHLVRQEPSLDLGLYRNGHAVSFHEFWAAFGSLHRVSQSIISDNFETVMLNMDPLRPYEFDLLRTFEYLSIGGHGDRPWRIHPAFSRYWLHAVFQKCAAYAPNALRTVRLLKPEEGTSTDRFGNATFAVKSGNAARIAIEPGKTSRLRFGFHKRSLAGTVDIKDSAGRVLVSLSESDIPKELLAYWNPHLFIDLPPEAGDVYVVQPRHNAHIEMLGLIHES